MHLRELKLSLGPRALGKGGIADNVAECLPIVGGGISGTGGEIKEGGWWVFRGILCDWHGHTGWFTFRSRTARILF